MNVMSISDNFKYQKHNLSLHTIVSKNTIINRNKIKYFVSSIKHNIAISCHEIKKNNLTITKWYQLNQKPVIENQCKCMSVCKECVYECMNVCASMCMYVCVCM